MIQAPDNNKKVVDELSKQIDNINYQNTGLSNSRKKKHILLKIALIVMGFFLLLAISATSFYIWQLQPVSNGNNYKKVQLTIKDGESPSQIGINLKKNSLIKSDIAFNIFVKVNRKGNELKAGVFTISSSQSTPDIVKKITSGKPDELVITFYPGATLNNISKLSSSKRTDARYELEQAGFSDSQIDEAFSSSYSGTVFKSKPSSQDLEGLLYGDTYAFDAGTNIKGIIQKALDEYDSIVSKYNLVAGFSKQGLSLYQGITLASIVQKEASGYDDQRQVAQVFLKRYKSDMTLGSDVTYQYVSDKLGVARSYTIDSPYNTRLYKGLPPGPISVPGLTALRAVADPADGDYLYFLAGDDGKMYYAETSDEHQNNISQYCQKSCASE